MKTETDIQIISDLRASLNGKVIGSDDPRFEDVRRVFFTASTVGPRPSSASATPRTSRAS